MRVVLLTVSCLTLGACSEPRSAPVAPAIETPAPQAPTTGIPGDANKLGLDEIASLLVGEFRSTQDEKVTVSVTSDGRWVEAYEGGGEPSVFSWQVFAGDQPPAGAAETFTPASRYLELKSDADVFYYEMGTISQEGFDMFFTRRGNMLDFARIKAPA